MKKLWIMLICLIFVTSLVGCSKELNISADGINVYCNGTAITVTELRPDGAEKNLDDGRTITYWVCESIENCVHRSADYFPEDLTSYKEGKYYTENLDSDITLYIPFGDNVIECIYHAKKGVGTDVDLTIEEMYNTASAMILNEVIETISFKGIVDVKIDGLQYRVRPKEIVIPGLIRVGIDDGSREAVQYITIGEFVVGKTSTPTYDYYLYNGVRIQVPVGTDITQLVTLH